MHMYFYSSCEELTHFWSSEKQDVPHMPYQCVSGSLYRLQKADATQVARCEDLVRSYRKQVVDSCLAAEDQKRASGRSFEKF